MTTTTTYVTQWLDSDGYWRESIGADNSGSNQQAFYAGKAGKRALSLEGAGAFAIVLLDAESYGPERVRIVKRDETVISTWS